MKMTKKVISVLLAVLMAFSTMLPLTALAATNNSSTDAAVTTIKNAMTAYETKMNGQVYSNMKPAYEAYVNANKALDAYVYGDAAIDLNSYATTLTNATNAMSALQAPTANASAYSRDVDGAINSDYAKNLIYTEKPSDGSEIYDEGDGNKKNVRMQMIYSNNTIALYDGVNTIRMPIFCFWYFDASGFDTKKVYALFPTDNATSGSPAADSTQFKHKEGWHSAQNGTGDWNACWNNDSNRCEGYESSKGLTATSTQANRAKWNRMANYIDYVGGDNGFTNGYKKVNLGWYGYTGKNVKSGINSHYMANHNDQGNIYIIDYKSHDTAIKSRKADLADISKAKQGGAMALFNAYDDALAAAYDVVNATPSNVAEKAGALVSTATALKNATVTTDDAQYEALRKEIDSRRAAYNDTASAADYTTASWNAFVNAYDTAKTFMANVLTAGYTNGATATADAAALKTAYEGLEVNFSAANTAIIEDVIDDAEVAIANKSIFITSTYNSANLEALVPQAKTAIWTAEQYYKVPAKVVADTQQDMVDGWVVTIGEAIALLQINKDATVGSAAGNSMNSAIALGDSYAATAADYSNYTVLKSAVDAAKAFDNRVIADTSGNEDFTFGIVDAKVTEYKTLVENIIRAINNLQPSFSKIQNGTVINTGVKGDIFIEGSTVAKSLTDSTTAGHVNAYKVGFTYPTSMVYFRTNHNAEPIKLQDTIISFYNQQDEDGYLDSINISGAIPQSWELAFKTKEDGYLTDDERATYPGSLVQGQYALGHVDGVANSGIFFNSEEGVDKTADLATTNGTRPVTGSVFCRRGSIVGTATTSLLLTATAKKTLDKTTTVPTMSDYQASSTFGAIAYCTYNAVVGSDYYGYIAFGGEPYTMKTTVIDVAYLFDLYELCDGLVAVDYTATSWAALETALQDAKGSMDYANMEANDILAECQRRYQVLYVAYSNLDEKADFSKLDAAVANLTVEDYKYDVSTLESINTTLKSLVYANYTKAQRDATGSYDYQAAIDKETAKVEKLVSTLTPSVFDDSAFDAAYDEIKASMGDPDAFVGLEEAKAILDEVKDSSYQQVQVGNKKVWGIALTQDDINNAITEAKTCKRPATYNVYVNGELYNETPIPYGEMTTVNFEKKSDIYYHYVSNTTETADKFYTTDNVIHFVVKGNTYITTQDATTIEAARQYKVSVKNGLTNKVLELKYLDQGSSYTLPDAPEIAFYDFTGYTINSKAYNVGDTITVDANMVIIANYEASEDAFQMALAFDDYNGGIAYLDYASNYNELIQISQDGLTNNTKGTPKNPSFGYIKVNGEQVDGDNNVRRSTSTDDIFAYMTVPYSYYENDDFMELLEGQFIADYDFEENPIYYANGETGFDGVATLTAYSPDYSFYSELDTFVIALSEMEYEAVVAAGIVATDANGAAVKTTDRLVQTSEKISIISTYALPDGAELVECGLLLSKGEVADYDDVQLENYTIKTGVYRLKSTQHTVGNQYVISLLTKSMPNGQKFTYKAYATYKLNGNTYTTYSDVTNTTYNA